MIFVQRRLVIAALALASSTAHADDPRDIFGLPKKPSKSTDTPDCADAATFGCSQSNDPFASTSPYALSTWLSADYLDRLPVADSSVDQVAHWATGASRDEAGVAIGGATGLENRWTVEGAPVDNLRSGVSELRVPLAFVSGIRVTAGGFAASDRTGLGGTIDATLVRGGDKHELESRAYFGLSADSPQRPRAAFTYSLYRLRVDDGFNFSGSVVAKGPLGHIAGGKAWYAVGLQQSQAHESFQWTAARLVDQNNDGDIDGLPYPALEPIAQRTVNTTDYSTPYMARVGWDRGVHHIDLTLIGEVDEQARFLTNASAQAAGIDRRTILGTGIATWHGDWAHTHARVQLSWQRSDRRDRARDSHANIPQVLTAYVPKTVADDPQVAQGCNDNRYPGINECPIITGYYATGGAGILVHSIADRPVTTAEVSHQIGNHVLEAGGTFEDATAAHHVEVHGRSDRALVVRRTRRCRQVLLRHVQRRRVRRVLVSQFLLDELAFAVRRGLRGGHLVTAAKHPHRRWAALRAHGRGAAAVLQRARSSHRHLVGLPRQRHVARVREHGPQLRVSPGRPRHDDHVARPRRSRTSSSSSRVVTAARWRMATSTASRPARRRWRRTSYSPACRSGWRTPFSSPAGSRAGTSAAASRTSPDGFINPGHADGDPAIRATEQGGAEVATSPTAHTTVRIGWMYGRTVGNYAGPYDPQTGAGAVRQSRTWTTASLRPPTTAACRPIRATASTSRAIAFTRSVLSISTWASA